jgi:hypothetical protein
MNPRQISSIPHPCSACASFTPNQAKDVSALLHFLSQPKQTKEKLIHKLLTTKQLDRCAELHENEQIRSAYLCDMPFSVRDHLGSFYEEFDPLELLASLDAEPSDQLNIVESLLDFLDKQDDATKLWVPFIQEVGLEPRDTLSLKLRDHYILHDRNDDLRHAIALYTASWYCPDTERIMLDYDERTMTMYRWETVFFLRLLQRYLICRKTNTKVTPEQVTRMFVGEGITYNPFASCLRITRQRKLALQYGEQSFILGSAASLPNFIIAVFIYWQGKMRQDNGELKYAFPNIPLIADFYAWMLDLRLSRPSIKASISGWPNPPRKALIP